MMVLGVKGMLEGQLTLPHGTLHCWTAADEGCDLLQAAYQPTSCFLY